MRLTLAPLAALITLLAVAGCVGPPPPPRAVPAPVAVPRPAPPPPVPRGADWRDWPVTPGDWAYRTDGRGTVALFGAAGADAVLILRCDRAARMVYLSRAGMVAAPLTVRTTSLERALPMQSTGGTPAYVATAMTPSDPLLDAMAFSRGRFIIEQSGAQPLVVPAWAEVGRVVEDCRR